MANVLLVSGHPDLSISAANKRIIEKVTEAMPDVVVRDLGAMYSENKVIDVPAEQQAITDADIIVFQFPLYWFSVPAIMKQYFDEVLVHRFAYNSKGGMLQGKKAIFSFTAAGTEEDYSPEGVEGHKIDVFVPPLTQIAYFCGMENLENIITLGVATLGVSSDEDVQSTYGMAEEHAKKLVDLIQSAQ